MKAPAFMFYTGDFLSSPDVQLMEAHEVGAYCLLLFNSWQSDRPGYLPDDEHRIRRTARLSPEQWAHSRDLLLGKFPPAPDDPARRHNPRLVQEAAKQGLKRERLAANGRKGGRPINQLLSENNQLVSQNPPAAPQIPPAKQKLPPAKQKLSNAKQLPPAPEAIVKASIFSFTTSNEVERGGANAPAPAPLVEKLAKPPAHKPAPAPPTVPEVQAYAAAQHPGPAAQAEAAAFHDHYQSNGWRVSGKTPMQDWPAAFRQWMRRRAQFQPPGNGGPPPPARARTAPKPADPKNWS